MRSADALYIIEFPFRLVFGKLSKEDVFLPELESVNNWGTQLIISFSFNISAKSFPKCTWY